MVAIRNCTYFSDMPDEAIYNILNYLSVEDVCAVTICSRSLANVAANDDLWFVLLRNKWGSYLQGLKQVWISHACKLGQSIGKGLLLPAWLENQLNLDCLCSSETSIFKKHYERNFVSKQKAVTMDKKECTCPVLSSTGRLNPPQSLYTHKPCAISSRMLLSLFELGKIEFPVQILSCELYLDCLLSAYDGKARMKKKIRQEGGLVDLFEVTYSDSMQELSMDESLILHQKETVLAHRLRPSPLSILPKQTYGGCDIRHLFVGDFVEVQWRPSIDLPFTWFFGQVRHFLFCGKSTALNQLVPFCDDCVCNQMRRVCVTFRKFGFDYVERSLFVDKETPSVYRQVQSVGFTGSGTFGGLRKIQRGSETEAWLNCGRKFQLSEKLQD